MALAKYPTYLTWHTQPVYSDAHNVAFRKGDAGSMTLMVLSNLGDKALNYSVQMANVGFTPNMAVVEVLSCRSVVVDGSGGLRVDYKAGLPMVSFEILLLFLLVRGYCADGFVFRCFTRSLCCWGRGGVGFSCIIASFLYLDSGFDAVYFPSFLLVQKLKSVLFLPF